MTDRDKLKEITETLDGIIKELDEFCNDVCNATVCDDCPIRDIIDELDGIIETLEKGDEK